MVIGYWLMVIEAMRGGGLVAAFKIHKNLV